MSTKIEWATDTWNPTTGCDRCSPGCDNCYALTMAKRLKAMGQPAYQRDGDPRTSGPGFGLTVHPDRLDLPLRWRKPRRIFVNSMSDLFHPDVPVEFIQRVWDVMAAAPQHTFQILTKRPQRMAKLIGAGELWASYGGDVLSNVWLGTSVENQRYADLRIPHLLATPAAVRFLSVEPLLGPVGLSRWLGVEWMDSLDGYGREMFAALNGDTPLIDWVIVGGESGPRARPMRPQWARTIRDQCVAAGVAFHFKQWGEWGPFASPTSNPGPIEWLDVHDPERISLRRVGKKAAGRELDGREWNEVPR